MNLASHYLYAFAAKDIQSYILRGGKLREMIGGSELINAACGDFLRETIDALGLKHKSVVLTQAAGWARILFEDDLSARTLYDNWPFLVDRFAPGLQVIQAYSEVSGSLVDAIRTVEGLIRVERNKICAVLPELGPLVDRNPRTGLPAICKSPYHDRQSARKDELRHNTKLIEKISGGRFVKDEWTDDLKKIAGKEQSYIAVIHADGNSLGKVIIELQSHIVQHPNDAAEILKWFSAAIEDATVAAARKAYERVLLPDSIKRGGVIAARPIVLGGDDLTVIVRADLAFSFAETFLFEFEKSSTESLGSRLNKFNIKGLPQKLTACAGIAIVKAEYPFARAYELAESLCGFAKNTAKNNLAKEYVPSCFAFHRSSSSISGDYQAIQDQELTARALVEPGKPIRMWAGPYGCGDYAHHLIPFASLRSLAETLEKAAKGSVRELITTLYTDVQKAEKDFSRIIQVLNDKSRKEKEEAERLQDALKNVTGDKRRLWTAEGNCPLLDAHRLTESEVGK